MRDLPCKGLTSWSSKSYSGMKEDLEADQISLIMVLFKVVPTLSGYNIRSMLLQRHAIKTRPLKTRGKEAQPRRLGHVMDNGSEGAR